MSKGFDISKVKQEIDSRKTQKTERAKILGENTSVPVTGNAFLKELKYSRENGVKTGASVKVAAVAKVADAKATGKQVNSQVVTQELLEHAKPTQQRVQKVNPVTTPTNSKEEERRRIAQLAEQMEQQERMRGGQTLTDAISQYASAPHVGAPMNNNGYLTEEQMRIALAQKGMQPMAGGGMMNSGMIVEQVNNVAQEFLNENFGSLFSEALKQTIVETYKADRVKAALQENREMIKEIVIETILELQKRNQQSKKA